MKANTPAPDECVRVFRLILLAVRRCGAVRTHSVTGRAWLLSCVPAGDRCRIMRALPLLVKSMVASGVLVRVPGWFFNVYGNPVQNRVANVLVLPRDAARPVLTDICGGRQLVAAWVKEHNAIDLVSR